MPSPQTTFGLQSAGQVWLDSLAEQTPSPQLAQSVGQLPTFSPASQVPLPQTTPGLQSAGHVSLDSLAEQTLSPQVAQSIGQLLTFSPTSQVPLPQELLPSLAPGMSIGTTVTSPLLSVPIASLPVLSLPVLSLTAVSPPQASLGVVPPGKVINTQLVVFALDPLSNASLQVVPLAQASTRVQTPAAHKTRVGTF